MGEGPLPISEPVSIDGGGALRRVMVRFVDGPGPASARGVVGSDCDCDWGDDWGWSLKRFIGLSDDVSPLMLRLRSGRLLRNGIVGGAHAHGVYM